MPGGEKRPAKRRVVVPTCERCGTGSNVGALNCLDYPIKLRHMHYFDGDCIRGLSTRVAQLERALRAAKGEK